MDVPCFRCLFMENLKARACKPADCEELSQWIFSQMDCEHPRNLIVKAGSVLVHGVRVQLYRCKVCHRTFRVRPGFDFKMKHPKEIIQFAKTLSQKIDPAFSTRDIAALIQKTFGIKVSHVTVNKWINS